MLATLLNVTEFVDLILSVENNFDEEAKKTFHTHCLHSWSDYYRQSVSVIVPVHEAKHHIDGKPNNWLYDRASGLVWINLEGGMHSTMMAALYILRKGGTTLSDWTCEQSDAFVLEGHGMFLSSVGDWGYKGSCMNLTRQEKIVFSAASIRNLDDKNY